MTNIMLLAFAVIFFIMIVVSLIKNKFEFYRLFKDEEGEPQMISFLSTATYIPFLHLIATAEKDPTKHYLILVGIVGLLTFFPELTRDLIARFAKKKMK